MMTLSQKKILIVEDNEINRAMLGEILSPAYQVLEAENGLVALSVLKDCKDEISLILLDIHMPVMDGYTFLSRVKADASCSAIPVIVTTQSDDEADEVSALSHGAADFVAKPYKPQIILHRVASIINLRETAAMVNQFQYDRLTGLYSKEFFYQRVRDILTQHPDKKYDLICSDIVNFKLFNDVFGMPAGDQLLRSVAEVYTRRVENKGGICSHFDADQYACLLEHYPDYNNDMFIQAQAEINALAGSKNVAVKWGIYSVENTSLSVEQMCDRAILAARNIKDQYGTYFARYDDELRNKMLREQAITDMMEPALAQEQFEIYLQPKYRIKDNSLSGAEALVRWHHPEWGFLSPGEFIPLFEKNGFITKLDQYVWDRACAVLQEMEQKGYPLIPISVNVSRADIYNSDLPDILLKTIEKYNLPPSRLHLEITESAYTKNPKQIIEMVGHLRDLGFVVEMDDFGSGYSSLNMLNQMPLDILKLDMEFIRSETAKPANEGILRFIMGIARLMDLSVVAEGVETGEQLERLREIDCDYVQGYYFARPMPYSDFERLVKKEALATANRETQIAAGPGQRTMTLLVVDEDEPYRCLVKKTFESQYEVVELDDADAALSYITGVEPQLAAVVLSLTLLGASGFSVLKRLKKEKIVWRIPVIVTGPSNETWEDVSLKMGADDYACKPHTQASLYNRVQRAVELNRVWQRERTLREEAFKDFVTGLLNRWGFDYAVKALGMKDSPLALYLFNVDNMKQINDTYGRRSGEKAISLLGSLLQSHIRGTDILARFSGDEFIAVIKQMDSEEVARKKGEDICKSAQESLSFKDMKLSFSAGLVMWKPALPMETAIERAEDALEFAKKHNRGGCTVWSDEMPAISCLSASLADGL